MPPEVISLNFPKCLQKATSGRIPKRYVVGRVPARIVPAYKAVRWAILRVCRSVYRYKYWLLGILVFLYMLARLFKNGMPGADAPHPAVYRKQMQMQRWYGNPY